MAARKNIRNVSNPTIPIPAEVSKIHGIFDNDVKDEPTFAQRAHELLKIMDQCDFAGFNSNQI